MYKMVGGRRATESLLKSGEMMKFQFTDNYVGDLDGNGDRHTTDYWLGI